jgi:hypothetical protein
MHRRTDTRPRAKPPHTSANPPVLFVLERAWPLRVFRSVALVRRTGLETTETRGDFVVVRSDSLGSDMQAFARYPIDRASAAFFIDFPKQSIANSVMNEPHYPGYASSCEK